MTKSILTTLAFLLLGVTATQADTSLIGLNTSGTLYDVDIKTGALTQRADEQLTSFALGPIARNKKALYYIAAPSGTSENAIYTLTLKTNVLSHVDLDRDDDPRSLFFNGTKLFGLFFNNDTSLTTLCRINPLTGVTTKIFDLGLLADSAEPVGGAITRIGDNFYALVKPEGDSARRQLFQFKTRGLKIKFTNVESAGAVPALCDRLKANATGTGFVCLASPSTTEVSVCKVSLKGKATCSQPLANVLRIAGGHTMMVSGKNYYAFVYAPDESNNQRLIKFTAKGVVKTNSTIATLIIGARFGQEDEVPAS